MSEIIDGQEYLTMQEAANDAGVNYSDITNAVHYHRTLRSRKIGTTRLVPRESLEDWKRCRTQDVAAAAA